MGKEDDGRLLVIIPAYNEEASIGGVLCELRRECPQADVLVVNDGSADGTLRVCREAGCPVLDLPFNLGLSGAFQAGLRYAAQNGYSYALQFDADGQHPADAIPAMLRAVQERHVGVVVASRYLEGQKGWSMREIGSRMIGFCVWLTTGVRIHDPTSGMRLYTAPVIRRLARNMNSSPEPHTLACLLNDGVTVAETPAVMRERKAGKSYLNALSSIRYMFQTCLSILLVNRFQ